MGRWSGCVGHIRIAWSNGRDPRLAREPVKIRLTAQVLFVDDGVECSDRGEHSW
jgi:hypothetical protein